MTWPSPATTTWPPLRTERIVVPCQTVVCRDVPCAACESCRGLASGCGRTRHAGAAGFAGHSRRPASGNRSRQQSLKARAAARCAALRRRASVRVATRRAQHQGDADHRPGRSRRHRHADIATGIGFLDHMLEQLAKHSLIDLKLQGQGRSAHRFSPHHRGHRLSSSARRCRRRSATAPASAATAHARDPDGRDADPGQPRRLEPALSDLEGRIHPAQARRDGHRAVQGVVPGLRPDRPA